MSMSDPDKERSFWEKAFGEVNLRGFGNRERLADRVYDEKNGTPEQRLVYHDTRRVLGAYEAYFHSQADDFIAGPPEGVTRHKSGILRKKETNRFSFKVDVGMGEERPGVIIEFQRPGDMWLCRSFRIDNSSIKFDKDGSIIQIKTGFWGERAILRILKLGSFQEQIGMETPKYEVKPGYEIPERVRKNLPNRLWQIEIKVKSPKDMAMWFYFEHTGSGRFAVQRDGTLQNIKIPFSEVVRKALESFFLIVPKSFPRAI